MLLGGAVPHHVDLILSNSVIIIKEFEQEITLFYNFRVETFAKHHIEDSIIVHPLNESVLCKPSLSEHLRVRTWVPLILSDLSQSRFILLLRLLRFDLLYLLLQYSVPNKFLLQDGSLQAFKSER